MKRILTLLLVIAGLSVVSRLNAQTAPPPPPAKSSSDTAQASKKAETDKAPTQGSSDKITIDEGGTSKPKHKKGNKTKKADEASPAAPGGIAIDESGPSRPKTKPRVETAPGTGTPAQKSDSTILAPAGQVGRPE
jgi:hypothetical protein